MISINVIQTYRDVVAICDTELIGKVFEEGVLQLDIKESFYKGDDYMEKTAIELIKEMSVEDATFNIVGEKSVNAAIKAGIINEEAVGKIAGIPYSMVLL